MDQSEQRAKAEQEYASLVIKVGGRDALPVRAIPYVTGWTISPDVVAENFARDAARFEKLENTDTYHLVDNRPIKLLPKEWDRYVAALQGLEVELRENFSNDERGYAAWVSESVAKLPAGVFVWLDEFVADFEPDYGPERLSIMGERDGDRELNLSPFLENRALNMVLEGFERRTPLITHSGGDDYASLVEYIYNGRVIDWEYWVQQMPNLSPGEACRLLAGLDPELYEDLASRPVRQSNPLQPCSEAGRMQRLALAEKRTSQTPDKWYRWALARGFDIHRGFFMAVYGRYLRENEALVLRNMPRAEANRWERASVIESGQRQVSMSYSRSNCEASMTFPDFIAEVDERLARWRRGRYKLVEAAQVLADSAGLDGRHLAEQMESAIHAGKLIYRINNIRVDQQHIPQERFWHNMVFQDDVNAWLATEAIGGELRLEYPYSAMPASADSYRSLLDGGNGEVEQARQLPEHDIADRNAFEKARADERVTIGWHFLDEAAESIVRQRGLGDDFAASLLDSMKLAIEDGTLEARDAVHQLPVPVGTLGRIVHLVRREFVNKWLTQIQAGYLWENEARSVPGQSGADHEASKERRQAGCASGQIDESEAQTGGRPRVLWRLFLEANLDACISEQAKNGPRGLIRFMCSHGANYRIHANPTDSETILYESDLGDKKPVKKKTIQTAIGEIKKARGAQRAA